MNGVNNIKSVNIAGGGIAGLSSAHLLKRNGYYPIVYEKNPILVRVGMVIMKV